MCLTALGRFITNIDVFFLFKFEYNIIRIINTYNNENI